MLIKKIKLKIIVFTGIFLFPYIAFAAPSENTFAGVLAYLGDALAYLVLPLLIAFAVVYFLWGLLKYIGAGGDEKKIEEGRGVMIFGIIAIFFMVSIWGFVNLLVNSFFDDGGVLELTEIDVLKE